MSATCPPAHDDSVTHARHRKADLSVVIFPLAFSLATTRPANFISPLPSAPVFRSFRGKFKFYLNARKVAARGIRLWLQLRHHAQEFCMTYVPGAPIASPGYSHGSGEPSPCRERQPRHRRLDNLDKSGS